MNNRLGRIVDCERCGKPYHRRRVSSRFCSQACSWATNGGRNRKQESWWTNDRGYIEGRVWVDGVQRFVKHHRWVMELALGRRLSRNEVVHHENGNKSDNRLDNLRLIPYGEHSRLHHTGAKRSEEARRNMSIADKAREARKRARIEVGNR